MRPGPSRDRRCLEAAVPCWPHTPSPTASSRASTWWSTRRRPPPTGRLAHRWPPSPPKSVIDELCERLAIEPVEFRMRNAALGGRPAADGSGIPPHRVRGGAGGGPSPSPSRRTVDRTQPGTGDRGRGLVQRHRTSQRGGQRQPRRHRQLGGGFAATSAVPGRRWPCTSPRCWAFR